MTISFFIDESGHSGDAIKSGNAYNFFNQPYFVLAALGIQCEATLAYQINELRAAHRIPIGELKSKSLQNRPAFVSDLLSLVCEQELPFFVEVVDKRYFICIHIVNCQLFPAVMGFREGPELHFIKNNLADFLYDEISDHILDQFVAACMEPSHHTLMSAFGSQLLFSARNSATSRNREIRGCMHHMSIEAMKEYEKTRKEDPEAYRRFLPLPDLNKHNKQIWMLPNLTSFTNIYARINLFRQGKLADVRLVHDQQIQLEDILYSNKHVAESIKDFQVEPFTPQADYLFNEKARLEFASSHESIGIQVADVIAGTVMRFYRDRLRKSDIKLQETAEAVMMLLQRSDASTGVGVNQVMPLRFTL